MAHTVTVREKAVELRKQGKLLREIQAELKVSRSTLSLWLRDVPLDEAVKRPRAHNGRRSETVRRQHSDWQSEGRARAASDERFRAIVALYWGEGSKGRYHFTVANCDPVLIRSVLLWLIDEGWQSQIQLSVKYHSDLTPTEVTAWWNSEVPELGRFVLKHLPPKPVTGSHKRRYGTVYLTVGRVRLVHLVRGGMSWLKDWLVAGDPRVDAGLFRKQDQAGSTPATGS